MKTKLSVLVVLLTLSCAAVCVAADKCNESVEKNEFDNAITACTAAIKSGQGNLPLHYFNRGYAYLRLAQYDRAIKDLTKTIELNPKNDEAYNSRAMAHSIQRRHEQAIADYSKAVELNTTFNMAYCYLAGQYSLINRPAEACKRLRQAIDRDARVRDYVEYNPEFENIRNTPCYKELMAHK